jgi:sugar lactone lactonase YvrE
VQGPRGGSTIARAAIAFVACAAIATVVWPAIAVVLAASSSRGPSGRATPLLLQPDGFFLGTWALFASSAAWIAAIASVAVLLGWPLGRTLADGLRSKDAAGAGRGRRWPTLLLAWASVVPLCVPAYLVFWSIWQGLGTRVLDLLGPDQAAEHAVLVREVVLLVGLASWAVPFVAWSLVAWHARTDDRLADLHALDGSNAVRRTIDAFRHDAPGLLVGWLVAFIALLGESVSFDLAQVRTYAFELRALDAGGVPPSEVLARGSTAFVLAAGVVLLATWLLARRASRVDGRPLRRAGRCESSRPLRSTAAWGAVGLSLLPLLGLVVAFLAVGGWRHEAANFIKLYARPATQSLAMAVASGVVLAVVASLLVVVGLRPVARVALVGLRSAALLWCLAAVLPATLVAIGLEAAWNRTLVGPLIYDTKAILVLALVARFGVVAVVAAAIALRSTGGRGADLRRLDDPRSASDLWRVGRPALVGAFVVALAGGTALALGDIVLASRLVPPGTELLAPSMLNAMHYQQPETVVFASILMIGCGMLAAWCVVACTLRIKRSRGVRSIAPVMLVAATFLFGCERDRAVEGAGVGPAIVHDLPPIPVLVSIGKAGFGPGQFRVPRAVAYDATTKRFFVVDKHGRIQRFDEHGRFETEWPMPESKVGKPVGLTVHPDGRIFVADTHYHRVLVFDQDGRELARFGSYGREPGQFIYVTDIAVGNDGRIYIGEYGGNDRIQIFRPDLSYAGSFGTAGYGDGELSRPQCLAFDLARNELYVADSNNHRIVVYDPDGRRLRQFGEVGIERGKLSYPRGIVLLGDGTILVVEFGAHRIQRWDATTGAALDAWGGMSGDRGTLRDSEGFVIGSVSDADAGRLKYPWDIAGVAGRIAVLDSGNDRMMIADLP